MTVPAVETLTEDIFLQQLTEPETGNVRSKYNASIPSNLPRYIVYPESLRIDLSTNVGIKLVDFGEAYEITSPPKSLRTPLPLQAPEVIFGDVLSAETDLWSMGCLLHELVTGQPPYDTIGVTKPSLVRHMIHNASDKLPERWQSAWEIMDSSEPEAWEGTPLQPWLEEVYFDNERAKDFEQDDIKKVGQLISRTMYFEPSSRASAASLLEDEWFRD